MAGGCQAGYGLTARFLADFDVRAHVAQMPVTWACFLPHGPFVAVFLCCNVE